MENVHRKRWLILLNVVIITFMSCVDSSSVNVALPMMADDLRVSMASIEWVVTANLLVIICFILLFGSLGDIKGQDKVFKWGIIIFLCGSLICALSNSYPMLIIGRMIEGFGASANMANSQGIIAQTFPSNERGRALGISGSFVALGTMLGPALGGAIISHFSWNMIFLVNIPVGIIGLLMAAKIMPAMAVASEDKLDRKGSVIFMIFIATLYSGVKLLQGGSHGHVESVIFFAVALVAGAIFIRVEGAQSAPMLELSLFKNRLFTVSVLCSFLSFFAISCTMFIQPFYLQKVLGITPALTGMLMMVNPVIMSVIAPFSGYLSDKIGSEVLCFVGLALSSSGLMLMSTLGEASSLAFFVATVALMSLGTSLFQSPNTALIMSTVPRNKMGSAGSINGLTRNLGMVFGISISTLLLYNLMSYAIGYQVTSYVDGRGDIFVYGMQYVYRFAAAIGFGGAILTGFRWREKRLKAKQ